MSGMGGLFELIIAIAVVGWGFVELRTLRRDRKKADEARAAERPMNADRLQARDEPIDPSPSRDP